MINRIRLAAALLAGTLLAGGSTAAQAQTVTWNLTNPATGGAPQNNKCVISAANTLGNSATCNANDPSNQLLTLRGYSFSGTANTSIVQKGSLNNQGASGIGMCNSNEVNACTSDNGNHAFDNYGTFTDFVLLQTTPGLVLKGVSFGWTIGDADFSVLRYTGAVDPLAALNSGTATISSLLTGGWSLHENVNGAGAGAYNSFNPGNAASNSWIIATRNTNANLYGGTNSNTDAFKLSSVTGTVVPEPSTYALMAAGLAGIGAVARRRRRTA